MSNNKERFYEQKSQHQESQESQPSREIKKINSQIKQKQMIPLSIRKSKSNNSKSCLVKVNCRQSKTQIPNNINQLNNEREYEAIKLIKIHPKINTQKQFKLVNEISSNRRTSSLQKPIKEEQSESEMNSVFNIEQEDSIIKLNDQFQRQASKQAFAQLYELDDCLEEMQEKNYIRNQIENTKIRKIDNIDQILRKEEWAEEKEKVAQLDFNPELEYQQLIDQKI